MRTTSPRIIDALMPRTRQRILAATLLQSERSWYAADLARHLGTSRSSLQRELAALIGAGILKCERRGRMVYVQANQDCPVFHELRGLLAKTAGLVDLLRDALKPFVKRIECAFVFGSLARAEETSASDVDLFIIGEVGLRDLVPAILKAQRQVGREVNPKLSGREEFAKRLAARDHFLLNVLDKPKLFLIGSQNELDQIVERKSRSGRAVKQV